MNYSKFLNVLFVGEEIEKQFTSDNKPEKRIGVTTMIPSISTIAYILDIKYDDLKAFFMNNKSECNKYEEMFSEDYNRCMNTMWSLTNKTDLLENLRYIDPTGIFYYNNDWLNNNLTDFTDDHIKKMIFNEKAILRLGNKAKHNTRLYYEFNFVSGIILKGFESKLDNESEEDYKKRCERIISDIRDSIIGVTKLNKNINNITFNCTPNGIITSKLYIKPKFDSLMLLKWLNKMKESRVKIQNPTRNKTI